MEYLLTFDNGSQAMLEHSGVKGMKWGVWNAETKVRYSGDKGSSRFNKDMAKLGKYEETRAKNASKAQSLQNKIDHSSKSAKSQMQLAKYERKAAVNKARGSRPYLTEFGKSRRDKQLKRAAKYDAKAQMIRAGNARQQGKLIKYKAKQLKAESKIKRLSSKIETEYKKAPVSSVTDKQKQLGRQYLNGVLG